MKRLTIQAFFYLGWCYGVGAVVGLSDRNLSGSKLYVYNEFGYNTTVACIYNETSTWDLIRKFTPDYETYPSIYLVSGLLPNSAPGTPEFFSLSSMRDNLIIVALAGTAKDNRFMYAFATGAGYLFIGEVQCEVIFEHTRLEVLVGVSNKTITLMLRSNRNTRDACQVKDIDPSGSLKKMAFRQPVRMSMIDTTLYASLLGNVFRDNYGNVFARAGLDLAFDIRSRIGPGQKQGLMLTTVAKSLESILDNSLLALDNAQIDLASDTIEVPVSCEVPGV